MLTSYTRYDCALYVQLPQHAAVKCNTIVCGPSVLYKERSNKLVLRMIPFVLIVPLPPFVPFTQIKLGHLVIT